MATVNNTTHTQAAYQNAYAYDNTAQKDAASGNDTSKTTNASKTQSASTEKMTEVTGAGTYGKPQLSEKALDYYNSLKKKYGNLNFVLVASDKKNEAEMIKGSFANSSNLTVLIDTDKIERMASDEAYRAKYEAIINNATSGLNQMKMQMGSTAGSVKAYGMSFDKSGNASFFAVIDKSLATQRERIAQKADEKARTKKEEAKKAEKEKNSERIGRNKKSDKTGDDDTITITAGSIEELLRKIEDYYQQDMFNNVRTEEEKIVGSQIDFGI